MEIPMKTRNPMNIRAILIAATLTLASCKTPGVPDTGVPGSVDGGAPFSVVDCFAGVGQRAVADAVARINTVIVTGVSSGAIDTVILRQLAGLAGDVAPDAFACAMQYVASKLHFDSLHDTGDPAIASERGSIIARKFIDQAGYKFAPPRMAN
jgi:hypothetical protein